MASYVEKLREQRRKERLASEMSHMPQEQYYNPIGDAISQWGRGVKERASHPLQTLANESIRWQRMSPDAMTSETAGMLNPVGGLVGMFAGKGAKTANLAMLAKADEMAKAGIPDAQIWKETGWALDTPDKIPRFEIPDNAASFNNFYDDINISEGRDIKNVLQHDPVYSGYPESANIQFSVNKSPMAENRGAFSEGNIEISNSGLGVNPEEAAKSTTLHELQHAIQQREGFARGGSPDDAVNNARGALISRIGDKDAAEKIAEIDYELKLMGDAKRAFETGNLDDLSAFGRKHYGKLVTDPKGFDRKMQKYQKELNSFGANNPDIAVALNEYNQTRHLTPFESYQRLAGEAEARLTQSRMAMTPEQRLAQYPYDPEYFQGATGVSLKDLIVRKE